MSHYFYNTLHNFNILNLILFNIFPICPVHFMSTFNAFPLFLTLSCIICFIISFASIFYTYDALCFYKSDEPQYISM